MKNQYYYYYYAIEVLPTRAHKTTRTHVCELENEVNFIEREARRSGGKIIRRFKVLIHEQMRGGTLCKMIVGEEQE